MSWVWLFPRLSLNCEQTYYLFEPFCDHAPASTAWAFLPKLKHWLQWLWCCCCVPVEVADEAGSSRRIVARLQSRSPGFGLALDNIVSWLVLEYRQSLVKRLFWGLRSQEQWSYHTLQVPRVSLTFLLLLSRFGWCQAEQFLYEILTFAFWSFR